jgi:hypothetical protein
MAGEKKPSNATEQRIPAAAAGALQLSRRISEPAAWAEQLGMRRQPLVIGAFGADMATRFSAVSAPGVLAQSLASRFVPAQAQPSGADLTLAAPGLAQRTVGIARWNRASALPARSATNLAPEPLLGELAAIGWGSPGEAIAAPLAQRTPDEAPAMSGDASGALSAWMADDGPAMPPTAEPSSSAAAAMPPVARPSLAPPASLSGQPAVPPEPPLAPQGIRRSVSNPAGNVTAGDQSQTAASAPDAPSAAMAGNLVAAGWAAHTPTSAPPSLPATESAPADQPLRRAMAQRPVAQERAPAAGAGRLPDLPLLQPMALRPAALLRSIAANPLRRAEAAPSAQPLRRTTAQQPVAQERTPAGTPSAPAAGAKQLPDLPLLQPLALRSTALLRPITADPLQRMGIAPPDADTLAAPGSGDRAALRSAPDQPLARPPQAAASLMRAPWPKEMVGVPQAESDPASQHRPSAATPETGMANRASAWEGVGETPMSPVGHHEAARTLEGAAGFSAPSLAQAASEQGSDPPGHISPIAPQQADAESAGIARQEDAPSGPRASDRLDPPSIAGISAAETAPAGIPQRVASPPPLTETQAMALPLYMPPQTTALPATEAAPAGELRRVASSPPSTETPRTSPPPGAGTQAMPLPPRTSPLLLTTLLFRRHAGGQSDSQAAPLVLQRAHPPAAPLQRSQHMPAAVPPTGGDGVTGRAFAYARALPEAGRVERSAALPGLPAPARPAHQPGGITATGDHGMSSSGAWDPLSAVGLIDRAADWPPMPLLQHGVTAQALATQVGGQQLLRSSPALDTPGWQMFSAVAGSPAHTAGGGYRRRGGQIMGEWPVMQRAAQPPDAGLHPTGSDPGHTPIAATIDGYTQWSMGELEMPITPTLVGGGAQPQMQRQPADSGPGLLRSVPAYATAPALDLAQPTYGEAWRTPAEPAPPSVVEPGQAEGQAMPHIDAIAQKVYEHLRRRLQIDHERRGRL